MSIATTDYDHFRDFRLGTVIGPGHRAHLVGARATTRCSRGSPRNREWDVAELSIAKFAAQVTRDEPDIVGLPVVCSRMFRFGAFYVNRRRGITTAEDLRGKRIGSPEWAHSAAVYMRGWLHNEVGVTLDEVQWFQAGANTPGREEKVELHTSVGVTVSASPTDRCPKCSPRATSTAPSSRARRTVFCRAIPTSSGSSVTSRPMEADHYRRTGVWPIMHIIAMRRAILDEHPWVARNLYNAFLESKQRSVERLLDPAVSRYPLPWLPTYGRRCATGSTATRSRTASRPTGRRWPSCCSTRTSKASRTGWPRRMRCSRPAS